MNMLKCALQASTKSTVASLRLSATATHIHLYITNALNRTDRLHIIGNTTLLFIIGMCVFF